MSAARFPSWDVARRRHSGHRRTTSFILIFIIIVMVITIAIAIAMIMAVPDNHPQGLRRHLYRGLLSPPRPGNLHQGQGCHNDCPSSHKATNSNSSHKPTYSPNSNPWSHSSTYSDNKTTNIAAIKTTNSATNPSPRPNAAAHSDIQTTHIAPIPGPSNLPVRHLVLLAGAARAPRPRGHHLSHCRHRARALQRRGRTVL